MAVVHRRGGFAVLLALGIDGHLVRCTGSGVSTCGGTLHGRRFGYLVNVLTSIACVAHGLEVVPVALVSVW